ncbi:hypothetical protein [Pedobacter gandavensis]|uniref:ABC transporter permease n=1 Tax=Pedobacter gandavensis TaxID=2679963 RepID=A0ABR6EVL6_9SPHI|nr:hypothetical protein [Pedobacter gandavensis]MBB2149289.1 hypothetical protein [Pedobacter gandavensis]
MNNIFNLRRFSQLFIKHTQEYYKTYLLSVGVIVALLAAILGFISYVSDGNLGVKSQYAIFFFFFIGAGSIFTSMIFSELGNSRKSITMLMLPASHFEKYLVAWIYSFLIYQLVFTLSFYAVDLIVLMLQNSGTDEKMALLDLQSAGTPYGMALIAFAVLHGITFLGAVFFEKLHFIKSACLVAVFGLFIILINQPLANVILGVKLEKVVPFAHAAIKEADNYYALEPQSSIKPIMIGMTYTIVMILWIGAYFKLKEKQV